MVLKRVIMILAASFEFERKHNSEVVERSTDNIEVPQVCIFYLISLEYRLTPNLMIFAEDKSFILGFSALKYPQKYKVNSKMNGGGSKLRSKYF